MRILITLLILWLCCVPGWAEQFVEVQGQKLVAFDLPDLEHTGTKDRKVTRATFARDVGEGKLQLTVRTKRWLKTDPGLAYRDERNVAREVPTTRIREPIEVPGADKVLMYTATEPYNALVIVLFTADFRCEMMVTGSKEAEEQMGPTYEQLLKTVRVVPKHER